MTVELCEAVDQDEIGGTGQTEEGRATEVDRVLEPELHLHAGVKGRVLTGMQLVVLVSPPTPPR